MKRFLCVWFPDWPLVRLRRARSGQATGSAHRFANRPEPRQPFVLVESGAHGLLVVAANAPARQLGVNEGLRFTDARARAPALVSEDIDRKGDAAALMALARWMIRLTPLVALDGEDGLMLETTGCDHLLGGEVAMMEKLGALLEAQGLPHQLGLASTPGAASALARAAPGTRLADGEEAEGLAGLPVSALRLSPAAGTLLRRFGLTRIGQLYGIDRKALARRFRSAAEADAVRLRLDQALGLRREPLSPLRPVPARTARLSCPEPIASSEAVRTGLEWLTAELCAQLSEFGQGARGFCLLAFRADGSQDMVEVRAARPVRSPKHVLRLFAEKLDRIDPGFGIDLLLLEAHRTGPMETGAVALSGDLAASDLDEVALSALADRITARLGEGRVEVADFRESHVPEEGEKVMAFDGALPAPYEFMPVAGPRPIRLFARPEPVEVLAEVPDGPPLRFIWRRIVRRVVRADGPERISPEWWRHLAPPPAAPHPDGLARKWLTPKMDPRADATQITKTRARWEAMQAPGSEPVKDLPRARDYYRVEDEEGRRYWVFRDGLYEDGRGGPPQWYVQGLFA